MNILSHNLIFINIICAAVKFTINYSKITLIRNKRIIQFILSFGSINLLDIE